MADNSLDQYEKLIVDELCTYQSQLEQGMVNPSDAEFPFELQPKLSEFRRCLDFIHATRRRNDFPIREPDTLSGYSLPSRIGRLRFWKDWVSVVLESFFGALTLSYVEKLRSRFPVRNFLDRPC